jgi:uncharacterized membrane protein YphA (DoxX/SURF4 family)
METIVSILLTAAGFYLLAGLLFALLFLWKGISKVDEDAAGSGVFFKILVLPGVVALWPVLLLKWKNSTRA